jgi:hypothetical protein
MRLLIVLLLLSFFSSPVYSETSAWELQKEEKDINLKIFSRDVDGFTFKEFKGEMLVKTQMTTIAMLLLDTQAAPDWMYRSEKLEVIEEIDELTAVMYLTNTAPWPVDYRDGVIMSVISQDPESLVLKAKLNIIKDRLPEYDDYVRIPHMVGFWLFEPKDAGQILVTYQVHADPGGSLPDWMANNVVVETPYYTMRNMANMLKLEKYQQVKVLSIKNVQQ